MTENEKQPADPGKAEPLINEDHCKGCGRCTVACPKKLLRFKTTLNKRGVNAVEYVGEGCTGCGICFYNCPEPYAISVWSPNR